MSLLLGASLSVGFEVSCLGVRLPVGKAFSQRVFFLGQVFLFWCWFAVWVSVFLLGRQVFQLGLWSAVWVSAFLLGRHFLNESSLWRESSCWTCDLLFGCHTSCWEGIFIIGLFSCTSIPVEFLFCCLDVSLPVRKTFSWWVFFLGPVFLLGFWCDVWVSESPFRGRYSY